MNGLRKGLTMFAVAAVFGASCGGSAPGVSQSGDAGQPTRENSAGYDVQTVALGRDLYEQTCAACHGMDLEGTQTGPPFLSPIYAPDHHPDEAFFAAATNGVQPHHWEFGPMPPQPGVTRGEVEAIVAFIRTQQIAAGVFKAPTSP